MLHSCDCSDSAHFFTTCCCSSRCLGCLPGLLQSLCLRAGFSAVFFLQDEPAGFPQCLPPAVPHAALRVDRRSHASWKCFCFHSVCFAAALHSAGVAAMPKRRARATAAPLEAERAVQKTHWALCHVSCSVPPAHEHHQIIISRPTYEKLTSKQAQPKHPVRRAPAAHRPCTSLPGLRSRLACGVARPAPGGRPAVFRAMLRIGPRYAVPAIVSL